MVFKDLNLTTKAILSIHVFYGQGGARHLGSPEQGKGPKYFSKRGYFGDKTGPQKPEKGHVALKQGRKCSSMDDYCLLINVTTSINLD